MGNKPVGTVAPNTHTTPSVQPRLIEPTDAGIIPPEYRTSFPGQIPSQGPSVPSNHVHNSLQLSNNIGEISSSDKKLHQWSTNPVEEWAKEQVFVCSGLCIVIS